MTCQAQLGFPIEGKKEDAMKTNEIDRLQKMLRELSLRERETARMCWELNESEKMEEVHPFSLMELAIDYAKELDPNRKHTKTMHEIEREIDSISTSAIDLKSKLENVSAECWLFMFSWGESSLISPPLSVDEWFPLW
ncbi:MAG TPA: hypothetical protein VNV60_11550 [Holophagaceae bacterium]|jgi:hypothetical protein|nr:hypothetical protein [Holophagaceae bacterium]